MEQALEQLLRQLVEKLRQAEGDDLVSVILYGSGAEPTQHDAAYSDINVLCVLREITPSQLAQAQPVFTWWRSYDNPAPLLLSEHEVATSSDCFPMEFRDLQIRRRVLTGRDVIEDLQVDNAHYRMQLEYELRSKLLRLRQKAAAVLKDNKLLARLLIDSVTTFCLLIRHALMLAGAQPENDRRAVLRLAGETFGIDPAAFLQLLDAREKKIKASQLQPVTLLTGYLQQIGTVIEVVDRMQTSAAAGAKGDL